MSGNVAECAKMCKRPHAIVMGIDDVVFYGFFAKMCKK